MIALFQKHQPRLIVVVRFFLGLTFFSSGMAKLYFEHSFPGFIGPVWLEDELSTYGLGRYARFIGASQVTIGLLLLTQRFATLGAIMCLPMISNIFMVTVSLGWQGTPYVNAFLIILNLWLLIYDYPKLRFIFAERHMATREISTRRSNPKADLIWAIGILTVLASIPLSYIHLEIAWGLCALALGGIAWNQLRKKKK
ncbi:MAG: hypothetical protein VYB44_18895 [Bacteroidota bacterium]|nr:hypothetical protein [Bacteroidota bacterium]